MLAFLACATPEPPPAAVADVVRVDARAWITRASLDVRGVRPSVADLRAVDADPSAAAALVDGYVDDARLGTRVAWMWNDAVHSALFFRDSPYRTFDLTDEESRALGWNPLEVVREVVDDDRPFTELVTAPTIPWNDAVAAFWEQPLPGSGDTWVPFTPDDGRPMAGMLSVTSLWFVYDADRVNLNRRRANAVSRIFACFDFLDRDGALELDLPFESLSALGQAAREEPACLSCHAGLDPIAAFLGGYADRSVAQPMVALGAYDPWVTDWYRGWESPAWFGHPGTDMADLGRSVAADPRFATCAVRRVAEGLLGHAADDDDLSEWTRAFVDDDGMEVRPLVRRIVASDAYRADEERVLTPEQLGTALADLTGWDPQETGEDGWMPLSWSREMRTLGGGTDDYQVLQRNREPGLGSQVLLTWAGRRAAEALAEDAARPEGERVLWTEADPDDADETAARAQIAAWYERFLGRIPDDASVDGLLSLWQSQPTPAAGGAIVLEALVRHPRSLLY